MNTEEPKPVIIDLSGKVVYRDSITASQAAQIIAFIDSSQSVVASPALVSSQTPPAMPLLATQSYDSPSEAIVATRAQTNSEKIVVLGNYTMEEEGNNSFTYEDVKPMFQRAGEALPKNLGRDFKTAVRSGLIAENKDGTFYIIRKGLDALEHGFVSEDAPAARKRKSSGRKNGSSKPRASMEVPEAIKGLDLEVGLPDVISLHDIELKRDRFLWIIAFAKSQGVDAISNKEVVFLANALGEDIPSSDINGHFSPNRKKGLIIRNLDDERKMRITSKGEEYLKSLEN